MQVAGPRTARRARPQRGDRGESPRARTEDKHWDWTLTPTPAPCCRSPGRPRRRCRRAPRSSRSRVSARSACSRTTSSSDVEGRARVRRPLPRRRARARGIRVNAVSGASSNTDALEHFPNRDEMLRAANERTPAGRMVEPRDIADAVIVLSGPHSQMIADRPSSSTAAFRFSVTRASRWSLSSEVLRTSDDEDRAGALRARAPFAGADSSASMTV